MTDRRPNWTDDLIEAVREAVAEGHFIRVDTDSVRRALEGDSDE